MDEFDGTPAHFTLFYKKQSLLSVQAEPINQCILAVIGNSVIIRGDVLVVKHTEAAGIVECVAIHREEAGVSECIRRSAPSMAPI